MGSDEFALYASSFFKVVVSLGVLYGLSIPAYLKVLLVSWSDMVDCGLPRLLGLYKNAQFCEGEQYQRLDKITDAVVYALLLLYVYQQSLLSQTGREVVLGLLIYRLLGVGLYLIESNRKLLFYFPNFFLEVLFVLLFTKNVGFRVVLICLVVVFKMVQEYFLHYVERKGSLAEALVLRLGRVLGF